MAADATPFHAPRRVETRLLHLRMKISSEGEMNDTRLVDADAFFRPPARQATGRRQRLVDFRRRGVNVDGVQDRLHAGESIPADAGSSGLRPRGRRRRAQLQRRIRLRTDISPSPTPTSASVAGSGVSTV